MAAASLRERIIRRHRQRQQRTRAAMREEAYRLAALAAERFSFRRLYLFGSVVADTPLAVWSDIDLAVEGLAPEDYFRLLGTLTAATGYLLDLKPWEELARETRERIEQIGELLHDAG